VSQGQKYKKQKKFIIPFACQIPCLGGGGRRGRLNWNSVLSTSTKSEELEIAKENNEYFILSSILSLKLLVSLDV
jgi:hypothetical protein